MVSKSTLERLRSFNMPGFVEALIAQNQSDQFHDLSFEDRLTLLVDAEQARRSTTRTRRLMKQAAIPSSASLEEVDFTIPRSLHKARFIELTQAGWLTNGTNVIITGKTGLGKTFLAAVLAHSLCLHGKSVRFQRTHHWLAELFLLEEQRKLQYCIAGLHKVPLLVFDEWLLDAISVTEARLLLDLFDDRYRRLSCMFISQLPVSAWHAKFQDPTLADAVLDRIVHNSIRIELEGPSVRETKFAYTDQREGENVAPLR